MAAVDIDGLDELRRDLRAVAADLPGGTGTPNQWVGDMKEAFRAVGNVIVPRAVSEAPKRTGRLAGSIRATPTAEHVDVTAGVPYAGPIHYGWPRRWPNYRPQPFLTDAAARTQSKWLAEFQKRVDKLLSRAGG